MIDVEAAKKEITTKSLNTIQKETAYKWASRAMAAKEMFSFNSQFMLDYNEYVHEALEHAALVEDEGFFLEIKGLLSSKG
jgi:hypothetical protein